jgi:hypothetical protein
LSGEIAGVTSRVRENLGEGYHKKKNIYEKFLHQDRAYP